MKLSFGTILGNVFQVIYIISKFEFLLLRCLDKKILWGSYLLGVSRKFIFTIGLAKELLQTNPNTFACELTQKNFMFFLLNMGIFPAIAACQYTGGHINEKHMFSFATTQFQCFFLNPSIYLGKGSKTSNLFHMGDSTTTRSNVLQHRCWNEL